MPHPGQVTIMGIFDKVLGTGTDKLNAAEGFAGVALSAIASDGVITEEEANGLSTSLTRMKTFQGMSPRQVNGIFEKLLKVVKSKGPEELIRMSSEAIPAELRPTAFAVAADLLFSDGSIEGSERAFLEKIQRGLQVDDATALKIVEVMQIKNRG